MKHTEIWYVCQMLIYELRVAYRASQPVPSTPSALSAGKTSVTVPWETRK